MALAILAETPLGPGAIPSADLLPLQAAIEQLCAKGYSASQVEGVHKYWVERRAKWNRPLLDRLCYEMPWNVRRGTQPISIEFSKHNVFQVV